VINGGIPGYGVYQQCVMLERLAARMRLDVVVSTFSLANDPVDDLRVARYAPDRLLEYSAEPYDPRSRAVRLGQRSRLFQLLHRRSLPLQFHAANVSGRAIRQVESSMARLAAECERRGIHLLLVTVPRRIEITSTGLQGWSSRQLTRRAKRMQERFARRRDIPLLDLAPTLLDVERRGSAYLASDTHWNERGHRAAAQSILDAIPPEWFRSRTASARAANRLGLDPVPTPEQPHPTR
jgi:hypothetical protein